MTGEHNKRIHSKKSGATPVLFVDCCISLMSVLQTFADVEVPDVEIDCAALTEKDIEDKIFCLALDFIVPIDIAPYIVCSNM